MAGARLTGDAVRFLVAGGLNTALTSLVYFIGLTVVPSGVSYTMAWMVGLAFVMVCYPERVFPGGRTGIADRLAMGASVIAVFLIGLASLHLLERALTNATTAFFITLAMTTILNFAISRWILRRTW